MMLSFILTIALMTQLGADPAIDNEAVAWQQIGDITTYCGFTLAKSMYVEPISFCNARYSLEAIGEEEGYFITIYFIYPNGLNVTDEYGNSSSDKLEADKLTGETFCEHIADSPVYGAYEFHIKDEPIRRYECLTTRN